MKLNEQFNDLKERSISYKNLAAVYNGQNNYPKSIEYFRLSIQIDAQVNDKVNLGRGLNNLAYTLLKANQLDSALYYANKALKNNIETGNAIFLSFSYRNLGDIYFVQGKKDFAIANYLKSLSIAEKSGNNFLRVTNYNRLGKVYLATKEFSKALDCYTKSVTIGEPQGFRDELDQAYKGSADAYHGLGLDTMAYKSLSKYQVLHDSIYNESTLKKINELQQVYENEKREAEIALLKKEKQFNKRNLLFQRQLTWLLVGLMFFLVATIVVYYLRNNDRQNANAALEKQKDELDRKNKAIEKQKAEMAKVYEDLKAASLLKDKVFSIIAHDIRSPLAALTGTMNLLDKEAISMEEFLQIKFSLTKQLQSLNNTLENLLHWSKSHMDGNATTNKIAISLYKIVHQNINLLSGIASPKGITIINNVPQGITAQADPDHIDIVVRNLLSNAIKFTNRNGVITIYADELINSKVKLSIEDSGVGIDNDNIEKLFTVNNHFTRYGTNREKGTGIGLLVSKEFIEKNNGSIGATSLPGKGSTFYIILEQ